MSPTNITGFNSLLSLRPLATVLRSMVSEDHPGARTLYQSLLDKVDAVPGLLDPITDMSVLEQHRELVETLLSTIFTPGTLSQGMYAISLPFSSETIFASHSFAGQFLPCDSNTIEVPDNRANFTIAKASMSLAYNLILRKFYNWDLPSVATSVHAFQDPDSGLTKYLELRLNAQFVEVIPVNDAVALPTSYSTQRSLDMEDLRKTFPLEEFRFEGLVVIDVNDVTGEQVIQEIKNTLLDVHAFSDVTVYDTLQKHIQTFLGAPNVSIGITPFFRINGYYYFSDLHYRHSILFKNERVQQDKRAVSELCQQLFGESDQPCLFQTVSSQFSSRNDLMQYYYEQGTRSLILCPLKCDDGQLIGLLEICSDEPGRLRYSHLSRIQSAMQLFTLALEKNLESLELQIDKVIKEHFTAILPAVEWKFTEAAFEYLQKRQESDMTILPPISFHDVYPLYAAIDIKNSSQERNNAIQQDLLLQLNQAHDILLRATTRWEFPLLKEIRFKVEKYIHSTSEALLSDDELLIYEFLQNDIDALFRHLRTARKELKEPIDAYFHALDAEKNVIYHHRKQYEDTITKINDTLDRFVDREQANMQRIFPHYFERYVTDGIDFNIYIGQSLAPYHEFNEIYVSNLKMWQLTLLVKATRLTAALEKRLPLPLQTTQLVLAHCIPLSISFRRKERKFDVDGAYNIRYEIIKKRIDKVHTKEGERLTQPGKIAIVYSQQKELNEYLEYVEYLQSEQMLTGDTEYIELEELQGISGLKAIRVTVNLEPEPSQQNGAKAPVRNELQPK